MSDKTVQEALQDDLRRVEGDYNALFKEYSDGMAEYVKQFGSVGNIPVYRSHPYWNLGAKLNALHYLVKEGSIEALMKDLVK